MTQRTRLTDAELGEMRASVIPDFAWPAEMVHTTIPRLLDEIAELKRDIAELPHRTTCPYLEDVRGGYDEPRGCACPKRHGAT